eukprot:TRINITY_DN53407_c0_g1_i1.p1 TRINITY_DN53407_c0_g1~~TRINITY_DN53407_c0_g1_i1.p1  ORF type:complete len:177 (-),score=50.39 TRINITY_DN53407_c0_g1_i1:2-532(-)
MCFIYEGGFFFFFKQKTAYEMLRSLVGSEMCIRDSMHFQSSIALRIAKYYPGVVDKMYIVNMGTVLAKCAKPIFSRMPAGVSERIQILTDNDLKKGRLLDLFDESVLPVELGGKYDCDKQEMFDKFAVDVEEHWNKLKVGALGCLLYTSDAADEEDSVDLDGRRIIKKKTSSKNDG